MRSAPGVGGTFRIQIFIQPHPRKCGVNYFWSLWEVTGAEVGGLLLGYLLGKNIDGVAVLISFRLTWDGCSSLLPFGGVLSFRLEAREALVSETARGHHAVWRCGGCVAARGAGAAGPVALGRCQTQRRPDMSLFNVGFVIFPELTQL